VWAVRPRPAIEHLQSRYDEEYYAPWRSNAAARRRMWRRRLRFLRGVRRGRLLDVGCAEGAFLDTARADGFAAFGTELSYHGAARTALRLGIPVHCGELESARFAPGSFSAVTLWHVLEHVVEPGATLAEARRILEPGGRLVVAVPNRRCPVFGAAYRIARGEPMHLYRPDDREQHLYHWEPRSLRSAMTHHGFEVLELAPDPCALGPTKIAVDLIGRLHGAMAGEPRTAAMVVTAQPRGGPS
jgi:SAM-dependent methyltransferase